MKRWKRFEEYLLSGLWHVHTEVTDGRNDVETVVEFAVDNRFPMIGFVEHIRRSPSYDFEEFYRSAKRSAREYDIECAVGCEAKVTNGVGEIDVSDADLDRSDVVYAAYHGTPFSRTEYVESLYATLSNPDVDVWAHPFSYAFRKGFEIPDREVESVLECAVSNEVLVEYNLNHEIDPSTARAVRERCGVIGYDLHDIDRWQP